MSGYSSLFRRPIGTFIVSFFPARLSVPSLTTQSFPNQDGMRAQLKAHLSDINRTADIAYDQRKPDEAIGALAEAADRQGGGDGLTKQTSSL